MKALDTITIFLAEVIGTGLLIFLGCGGCVPWAKPVSHFQITVNFGLAVMVVIEIFGAVSGAHFNPAVTAAAYIYKKVSVQLACIYVIGQLLGSFMGFGLLKLLTPAYVYNSTNTGDGFDPGLCTTMPHPNVGVLQALTIEYISTTVLILVCCMAVWDPRNSHRHDSLSLRFGLVVTCLAYVTGPYTGASFNPARSFGPALWNATVESQWIYWVAPMASGFITPILFKMVFTRNEENSDKSTIDLRTPEEIGLKEGQP